MMPFGLTSLLGPRALGALLAALLVGGCGGVDSGGTGAPATAFASGPISGFGSVIVAGVHFDERSASVLDADGNVRSRDDLRLGMTVEARGSAIVSDIDGNQASTATTIVIRSEIVGPVTANDLSARTFTVLGETVDVTPTTVFDVSLANGQASLAIGRVVEVYASVDAVSGHYVATRVEGRTAVAAFALRGIVTGLDTAARSFSIGAAHISYAGLAAGDVPSSLANGSFVRVTFTLVPGPGGLWQAIGTGDPSPTLDDHDQAKVEGLISAFASATQFSVNGTPVDARAAEFPDGTAGVALGKRVEVEGSVRAGVLVATRVRIESGGQGGGDFDVRGVITSIDSTAKTFVVRNVLISYAGTVDFRDGTALDLRLGIEVEARGALSSEGTRLQATRIDFRH